MIDFTERVEIEAAPAEVWALLRDVEEWWVPSNPEHESLEVLSDGDLGRGTRIRIRESIAGVPGEAVGTVTEYRPGEAITWQAPEARYRLHGIPLRVAEAVQWRVEGEAGLARAALSARVWAEFGSGLRGRLTEWIFRRLLNGVERDRAHARRELLYLKGRLEG